MSQPSDFAMILTTDQWRRSAHEGTALDVESGIVQLAWQWEDRVDDVMMAPPSSAALAFDPWCRLYRTLPDEGRIERWLWDPVKLKASEPLDLFRGDEVPTGDFTWVKEGAGTLADPRGLVVDAQGRLFIAETAGNRILIYDLVDRRLLRRVVLHHEGRVRAPVDLASDGNSVYALLPGKPPLLAVLDARTGPRYALLPEGLTAPARIQVDPSGRIFLLDRGGTETARIVPLADPDASLEAPNATDLVFLDTDELVIARFPGQDFLHIRIAPKGQSVLPHLRAPGYDGRGIVRTPDGRVGFWTAQGFATALLARIRHYPQGRVISYRLDSGEFQTVWGRLFVDACIPKGTNVKVRCLVMDEVPEDSTEIQRTPPENTLSMEIHRPDLSPPMPPEKPLMQLLERSEEEQSLHRRHCGNEFPWFRQASGDTFETYEAPVMGPAGRYLWVVLELSGTSRSTPKVRSLRVEYPSHDWLRRLPRVYSRDEAIADFLRRFLGLFEGELRDIDLRAAFRHVLLDPRAAPHDTLPWLAGFIGMVLDERWPETARRKLIEQGVWLFRYRGTVQGLSRLLEIYLGHAVVIIEHFKVRGLGGAFVGKDDAQASSAVLGAGFRVGGQVGKTGNVSVNEQSVEDAFTTHAHRFSVVIPLALDLEQRRVVEHILEVHRPAHTLYDLCYVDAGMRVGIALYLGLTSMIGHGSRFGRLQVGASVLGRTDVLGYATPGTRAGGSRLGNDSRVG